MISIMANNYFETIVQEPTSPEREIRKISSPPKLRRGDYTCSLTDNKEILLRKYLRANIEIEKLKTELNIIYEKHLELMERSSSEITINEKKLNNVQEILFENSEKIPEGIYIQLMDALVKT